MFQFNVPIVNACLWMRDDHAHVMQVKLCKANTRGVTEGKEEGKGLGCCGGPRGREGRD